MGELFDEFQATLDGLEARYRSRPRLEITRLLLLALEREQLVSVAYREEVLGRRLDELAIPEGVRELFRQSLVWAWKDEEMHAVFTRGLLVKVAGPWTRLGALAGQIAGSIGGWASAEQQHVRWRRAPVSASLARLVTLVGRLAGKVPRGVRGELRLSSLRSFAALQVDAERTAAACWRRLARLALDYPGLDERTRGEFERMAGDEDRHRQVFQILAESLDDAGTLREGVREQDLVERLGALGDFFLPRPLRASPLAASPVGRGGVVHVLEGEPRLAKEAAFARILDDVGLARIVLRRAAETGKPPAELVVAVKASFMLAYDARDRSMVVDRELLDVLARRLAELGVRTVLVGDGRNLYDQFYARRSVLEVARYLGLDGGYRVVDLTDDQAPHRYAFGLAQDTIARSWREADVRVVLVKLRSHPTDFSHLCLGGMQGVGARLEDYLFGERQAERTTALFMPLVEFPAHLALIEGYERAADGMLGVIACPDPPAPRRLYAAEDALAADLVATRHMGAPDPRRIGFYRAACQWFGDPLPRTEVRGPDRPIAGWRTPYDGGFRSLLSHLSYPVYRSCGGRGAAFVPPMDERAFPPRGRTSLALRLQRRLVRRLLGLAVPR